MSDFLPEDIVVDILSRLPAKSLIRFRCVSKVWNSLITSPNFISSHLNHFLSSNNNISNSNNLQPLIVRHCIRTTPIRIEHYKLFHDTGDAFHEYQEIEFPLKSRRLHFYYSLGYVKGLYCLYEQDSHFLWNPSIRKSLTIPKPRTKVKSRYHCKLGFGFDTRTHDYKIVRIVRVEAETPLVEVYSLNAGAWKINSGASNSYPIGSSIRQYRHYAVSFEGAVHFAANNSADDPFILSFDLGDEVFHTVSLPTGMVKGYDINTSVFGGCLSLLGYDRNNRKSCSIWIMKDYGMVDSWYKLFKFDLNGEFDRVVSLRDNGHILIDATAPIEWELSSYDPCSQQVKNLGIQGVLGHFFVDTFEENLVLLDKKDPVSRRRVIRKRKDRYSLEEQRLIKELQISVEKRQRFIDEKRRQIGLCQGMLTQIKQEHHVEERQRLSDLLQSMVDKMLHECRLWENSLSQNCGPTL